MQISSYSPKENNSLRNNGENEFNAIVIVFFFQTFVPLNGFALSSITQRITTNKLFSLWTKYPKTLSQVNVTKNAWRFFCKLFDFVAFRVKTWIDPSTWCCWQSLYDCAAVDSWFYSGFDGQFLYWKTFFIHIINEHTLKQNPIKKEWVCVHSVKIRPVLSFSNSQVGRPIFSILD